MSVYIYLWIHMYIILKRHRNKFMNECTRIFHKAVSMCFCQHLPKLLYTPCAWDPVSFPWNMGPSLQICIGLFCPLEGSRGFS